MFAFALLCVCLCVRAHAHWQRKGVRWVRSAPGVLPEGVDITTSPPWGARPAPGCTAYVSLQVLEQLTPPVCVLYNVTVLSLVCCPGLLCEEGQDINVVVDNNNNNI